LARLKLEFPSHPFSNCEVNPRQANSHFTGAKLFEVVYPSYLYASEE